MENQHLNALARARAKLVEQRRALAKRDASSDRNEGYAERIVSIQAAIEATEHAISDERKLRDSDAQRASGSRVGSEAASVLDAVDQSPR